MITLSEVRKTVESDDRRVDILRGVDLHIETGELVAITGPSGSGKSTLLNIVGLLDRPTSGSYVLAGEEVAALDAKAVDGHRSRRFGFVFQAFHLLEHRTVVDNVAIGLMYAGVPRAERIPRAEEALAAVGLSHRARFRARTLSGGEKQRAAIARAIVGGKQVVLCDEPTGNLDTTTGATVLTCLRELHDAGLTVVIVTHDAAVAGLCHRVVELRDGLVCGAA